MRRRRWFLGLAAGMSLIVLAIGASRWFSGPRLNVLLITLDTTRADRIGCYGGPAGLTPVLDEFAKQGIVFERAYAPVPITLPSHASIMTGLYPPEHGLRTNSGASRLGTEMPVLAELLKNRGYQTGAFVGSFVLDKKFGLERGFSRYDDKMDGPNVSQPGDPHNHRMRLGERVVDTALTWLKVRQSKPFFCWVHLFDPHSPYRVREEIYGEQYRDRPYDAGIAYVDGQVGRLLEFLEQKGLSERTLVIVVGDHGESLGEHQERTHGYTLYNATLHVPLIVRLPRTPPRPGIRDKSRISSPVSLVDLFPSTLAALNLKLGSTCSGRNLFPACLGEELPSRPCYAETDQPFEEAGWAPLRSVISDRWKYIRSPRAELYDLQADPQELNNLAALEAAEVEKLEQSLRGLEERLVQREAPSRVASPQDKRLLASLGYSSSGAKAQVTEDHRADIKDMLPYYNTYGDAQQRMGAANFQEAAELLETVVRAAPEYFQAWFNLGVCYQQLGRLSPAKKAFQRAVEIDGNAWAQTALGKLYLMESDPRQALPFLEAAGRFQPDSAEAQFLLGEAFRMLDRAEEARHQYQFALELDPGLVPAQQALEALPAQP